MLSKKHKTKTKNIYTQNYIKIKHKIKHMNNELTVAEKEDS